MSEHSQQALANATNSASTANYGAIFAGLMAKGIPEPEQRMTFVSSCVGWPEDDVHADGGLCDLIADCKDITRATFCRHVDRGEREALERQLGYAVHGRVGLLTMARDWHVSYHRSRWHGRRVYLFKHSAIEYVFAARQGGSTG
jgi:hypothetical protein